MQVYVILVKEHTSVLPRVFNGPVSIEEGICCKEHSKHLKSPKIPNPNYEKSPIWL
jgi:hypothetical protein